MSIIADVNETLSLQQARKLVLLSQKIPPVRQMGKAILVTQSLIEHLGYIQIDTILAVQRAHHHTLWNRNPRYKIFHLDKLVREKRVFEYWSHAAAYLPMCDYRYSLPRKNGIAKGEQNHWYKRNETLMTYVRDRIRSEGPLMARDFDSLGKKTGEWQSKPAKQALEILFMQGELMVPYRVKFHKVYDLTERVLPENTNTTEPGSQEYARYLITRYLKANGLAQVGDITYLQKNIKPQVFLALEDMLLSRELSSLSINGKNYYVLPESLELLSKPLALKKLKILSPFDNLIIQRKRMQDLFGFDYTLECYVPEEKRRYGYFSLPILWEGKMVARMDCRVDRKNSLFHIHHLALEPGLKKIDSFIAALLKELQPFLQFNESHSLLLHKTTPPIIKSEIQSLLNN